jgi:hypothetical protein
MSQPTTCHSIVAGATFKRGFGRRCASAVEIQACLLLTLACSKSSEVAAGCLVNRGQA